MRMTPRLPRETGRDYALRTIKDNIIHLDLAPGSMVSENELAAALKLSRTPVREALIELSKVQIVEIYPQRGSVVSLIDYDMVEQSRFMRKVLECAVIEQVCRLADEGDLEKLRSNVRLQNFYLENYYPDSLMELDNEFHRTLFEIARMSQVYTLMENIAIHFDRVRSMALVSVKNLKIVEDHERLVEAVERRDSEQARELMESHLSRYKIDKEDICQKYPGYFKEEPTG